MQIFAGQNAFFTVIIVCFIAMVLFPIAARGRLSFGKAVIVESVLSIIIVVSFAIVTLSSGISIPTP